MLRVALDYRPALLGRSGIARYVRELARALALRPELSLHLFGHSLAAVAVGEPPPPRARLHRSRLPGRALPWLARVGIGAERLAGGADLFHATDYVHPPHRATSVVTVHDLAFAVDPAWHGARQSAALLARTRRAVAGAAVVLAPTEAVAIEVRALVPGTAVRVTPLGVDHVPVAAARARPHPLGGRPYLAMVGTLEPRKGHRTLLAAWRRLPSPRPALVVIGGRGWLCDDVVAELRAAAGEGVRWLPDLSDDALWTWMAHAEVVAYPSHCEGFGLPPLEALALGVPVVAGDCRALREVLDDGAALCPPGDDCALADALQRLLADAPLRAECTRRGRLRAGGFTWRRTAALTAAACAEAVA